MTPSLPLTLGPVDITRAEFYRSNLLFVFSFLWKFALALFALELVHYAWRGWLPGEWRWLVREVLLMGPFVFGFPLLMTWLRVRRYYRASGHKLADTRWTLDATGLELHATAVQVRNDWREIRRIRRIGPALFVTSVSGASSFLPVRALPPGMSAEELLAHARALMAARKA